MLVWILQQFELSPQNAEQYCNGLKPKTIEMALNTLVGALFNALYGAAEGMPRTPARVPCDRGYETLATLFPLLPSLDSGASDALRDELRQFIRQQPDIQFNPAWGRWVHPICVSAAPAEPIPTRPSESAEDPIPGSAVGPEESQPNSVAASTPASPARTININSDPAIAYAIHAIKPRRPSYEADVESLLAKGSETAAPSAPAGDASTSVTDTEASVTEPEAASSPPIDATTAETASAPEQPETPSSAPARATLEPALASPATKPSQSPQAQRQPGGRPTDRDMVLEEAAWRLRNQKTKAKSVAAFARELRAWLEVHGEHRSHGDVMKVETIEDHVRPLWNQHRGETT